VSSHIGTVSHPFVRVETNAVAADHPKTERRHRQTADHYDTCGDEGRAGYTVSADSQRPHQHEVAADDDQHEDPRGHPAARRRFTRTHGEVLPAARRWVRHLHHASQHDNDDYQGERHARKDHRATETSETTPRPSPPRDAFGEADHLSLFRRVTWPEGVAARHIGMLACPRVLMTVNGTFAALFIVDVL
jgi:hypothetical protein